MSQREKLRSIIEGKDLVFDLSDPLLGSRLKGVLSDVSMSKASSTNYLDAFSSGIPHELKAGAKLKVVSHSLESRLTEKFKRDYSKEEQAAIQTVRDWGYALGLQFSTLAVPARSPPPNASPVTGNTQRKINWPAIRQASLLFAFETMKLSFRFGLRTVIACINRIAIPAYKRSKPHIFSALHHLALGAIDMFPTLWDLFHAALTGPLQILKDPKRVRLDWNKGTNKQEIIHARCLVGATVASTVFTAITIGCLVIGLGNAAIRVATPESSIEKPDSEPAAKAGILKAITEEAQLESAPIVATTDVKENQPVSEEPVREELPKYNLQPKAIARIPKSVEAQLETVPIVVTTDVMERQPVIEEAKSEEIAKHIPPSSSNECSSCFADSTLVSNESVLPSKVTLESDVVSEKLEEVRTIQTEEIHELKKKNAELIETIAMLQRKEVDETTPTREINSAEPIGSESTGSAPIATITTASQDDIVHDPYSSEFERDIVRNGNSNGNSDDDISHDLFGNDEAEAEKLDDIPDDIFNDDLPSSKTKKTLCDVKQSVVQISIYTMTKDRKKLYEKRLGTGAIIDRDLFGQEYKVLTSLHVCSDYLVVKNRKDRSAWLKISHYPFDSKDVLFSKAVLAIDEVRDLALIEVDSKETELPSLEITGSELDVCGKSKITAVGFPGGELRVHRSTLAGNRSLSKGLVSVESYRIKDRSSGGISGAPILDAGTLQVLGVWFGSNTKTNEGIAVALPEIHSFLSENRLEHLASSNYQHISIAQKLARALESQASLSANH